MSSEQEKLLAAVEARQTRLVAERQAQADAAKQLADARKVLNDLVVKFNGFRPLFQKAVETVNSEVKPVGYSYTNVQPMTKLEVSGRMFAAGFSTLLNMGSEKGHAETLFLLSPDGSVSLERTHNYAKLAPNELGFSLDRDSLSIDAVTDFLRVLPRVMLSQ